MAPLRGLEGSADLITADVNNNDSESDISGGLAFNTSIFRSQQRRERQQEGGYSASPRGKHVQDSDRVLSPGLTGVASPGSGRAVSFPSATSLPKPERAGSYGLMARMATSEEEIYGEVASGDGRGTAESSSADEGTAIMRKNRREARNYGATVVGAEQEEEEEGGVHATDGETEEDRIRPAEEHPVLPAMAKRKRNSLGRGRKASKRPRQPAQTADGEEEVHDGWWRRFVEKYGSVELENKGSVARDHLALERTFLAWLRTSLSFASIGIAVTQLFRLNTSLAGSDSGNTSSTSSLASASLGGTLLDQVRRRDVSLADTHRLRHVGKPLGATFLAISILILILGFHRYFESQHYVIRGKFPASRGTIILVSLVATALIVASLVVILVVAPSAFEKR